MSKNILTRKVIVSRHPHISKPQLLIYDSVGEFIETWTKDKYSKLCSKEAIDDYLGTDKHGFVPPMYVVDGEIDDTIDLLSIAEAEVDLEMFVLDDMHHSCVTIQNEDETDEDFILRAFDKQYRKHNEIGMYRFLRLI